MTLRNQTIYLLLQITAMKILPSKQTDHSLTRAFHCSLSLSLFFSCPQDANYEGLKVVASSYSFQGGKVSPRLLSDSKANSETLASKCKLSLCLSCRKTKNAKKTSRVPAATRERESGQNDTAQAEPNGERTVQLVNHNDSPNVEHQSSRTTCESGPSPSSSLSRHSSQSSVASKPSSSSLHSESSTVVRFLEVASSVRKLSVISEGESSTAAENQVDGSGERNHGRTPDGSGSSLAINGSKPKDASRRPSQPNCWGKVQKLIARFTSDSFFDMAITGCIVLNTLFLTLEYHNMNASFKEALDIGNMVSGVSRLNAGGFQFFIGSPGGHSPTLSPLSLKSASSQPFKEKLYKWGSENLW